MRGSIDDLDAPILITGSENYNGEGNAQEPSSQVSTFTERVATFRPPWKQISKKYSVTLVVSLAMNLVFIGLVCFFVLLETGPDDYKPVPPPAPPSNSTSQPCPFDRFDTKPKPMIAQTSIGPYHASICWTDYKHFDVGGEPQPYKVKIVDPWIRDTSNADLIYSGRALAVNLTDLLPASTYTVMLLGDDDKPVSKFNLTTLGAGYCGNSHDVAIYSRTARTTLSPTIGSCVLKGVGDPDKVTNCITKSTNLTKGCASCSTLMGVCALKECTIECSLSRKSTSCIECQMHQCWPDFRPCNGLPTWAFPPHP